MAAATCVLLDADLASAVAGHAGPAGLLALARVARVPRRAALDELERRYRRALDAHLEAALTRVGAESRRARRSYLLRFARYHAWYGPEPWVPRYRCARCGGAAHGVGTCSCRPRTLFPWRRVLLGPALACAAMTLAAAAAAATRHLAAARFFLRHVSSKAVFA